MARHGPRVHDLARRLTRDAHLAEDLTQQAFLNAWRALARFDAARPFRHWILRITTNLCRNLHAARQLRPQAPQGPPGDPDAAALDPPDPAPARADPEERARPAHVRAAIERLPERYRAPVVLYHLHGLPLEEVGAILDLPVATVKTHLHRGRAALRELLALPETGSGPAGTAGQVRPPRPPGSLPSAPPTAPAGPPSGAPPRPRPPLGPDAPR